MEIKHNQIGWNNGTVHWDYFDTRSSINKEGLKTRCGIDTQGLDGNFHFLDIKFEHKSFKVCKKCSKIYKNKYGYSLEVYLAELKIRGKLFKKY